MPNYFKHLRYQKSISFRNLFYSFEFRITDQDSGVFSLGRNDCNAIGKKSANRAFIKL